MMVVKAFVDTNVLLRAVLTQIDGHAVSDALIKKMLREGTELWISGQVIREFIVQATHPKTLKVPLTIEQTIHEIEIFSQVFEIADENPAVRATLLELLKTYPTQGKQVHDANLVATMLSYGIDTLLTINVDDMKRFSDKISIVSPITQ